LIADSVDFLEDAAVNVLVLVALGWAPRTRARVGMVLAGVLLIPALTFLWAAWQKFQSPEPPDPWLLSSTGLGALVVNVGCAFLLARFRDHSGSLSSAAFASARNDAIANVAIVLAGIVTTRWLTGWPDLIVGLGVAAMNADAATAVWKAARHEHAEAEP
jgi:Co/Zn/Cd efflux system component